jgi:thiol-disulfide isomerase/thioredoxin
VRLAPLWAVGLSAWGVAVFAQVAETASPEIRPLTAAELSAELAARGDRIVVLNMWATWCSPCLEEFPRLVQFAREVDPDRVAVMAVSSDLPQDLETKVRPFVAAQSPPFPVFLQNDTDDNFFPVVDPDWTGTFPHTAIIGPGGVRRISLGEFQSVEDLQTAVASAEGAPAR